MAKPTATATEPNTNDDVRARLDDGDLDAALDRVRERLDALDWGAVQ